MFDVIYHPVYGTEMPDGRVIEYLTDRLVSIQNINTPPSYRQSIYISNELILLAFQVLIKRKQVKNVDKIRFFHRMSAGNDIGPFYFKEDGTFKEEAPNLPNFYNQFMSELYSISNG